MPIDLLPFKAYKGHRVLITGGLGFIGSSIAHTLVALKAKVTMYDSGNRRSKSARVNLLGIEHDIRFIEDDLREQSSVRRGVKDQEIIFNLAALSSHVESNRDPFTDLDVNGKGQLILLQTIVKESPNAKVVFAGSRAEYGRVEHLPATETTPLLPVDMYGAHKVLGEHYHLLFAKHYGLRVTCLRKTNTYGPRHQMQHAHFGVQNYFIRLAMDNQVIEMYDGGKQLRDYVYIDDVVRAYLLCGLEKKTDGKVYTLGGGEPIRLIDYAKKVLKIVGSGAIRTVPFPKERKLIEIGDYKADFHRIYRDIGWRPEIRLDEGLRKTVAFYQKYRHEYW